MFENWEVAPFRWKISPRAAVKWLKAECWQILFVGCIVAGAFALISLFWFLHEHYVNATNAGWGDPAQDRHQWLLGWGILVSASVTLSCTVIIAMRSRRALISIATGTAFSVLVSLVGGWFSLGRFLFFFILPGWCAVVATFGVHSGEGHEVAAYFYIINALTYSGITFLLIRKRTAQ